MTIAIILQTSSFGKFVTILISTELEVKIINGGGTKIQMGYHFLNSKNGNPFEFMVPKVSLFFARSDAKCKTAEMDLNMDDRLSPSSWINLNPVVVPLVWITQNRNLSRQPPTNANNKTAPPHTTPRRQQQRLLSFCSYSIVAAYSFFGSFLYGTLLDTETVEIVNRRRQDTEGETERQSDTDPLVVVKDFCDPGALEGTL